MDDLSDWRYEGVIYRKNQDPRSKLGLRLLFAPDVAKGTDGRYYLYYAFDCMGIMGVAVIPLEIDSKDWITGTGSMKSMKEEYSLYFAFEGEVYADFLEFEIR